MSEKFVIFFGFPGTKEMVENVERFADNTNQTLEMAWIDLLHSFMLEFKPNKDGEPLIPAAFSEAYEMQVILPAYEQSKYPEVLGKTTFKLPALSFKDDFVTSKATGERIKIKDEDLEYLCNRFKEWIDIEEVIYEWR